MFNLMQTIEERESPFNGKIKVVKTLEGMRVTVEGISQSGWLVKKVWNSALKKVKKEKDEIEEVLILGLGGGSAAKLVNKYWPGARITGVDIDRQMIELGEKYLGLGNVVNLTKVVGDAEEYIDKIEGKKSFNLVLMDVYKGVRIPDKFTRINFLKKVKKILFLGGIACFNHLYSAIEKEEADTLREKIRKTFSASTSVKPEANIIFIGYKE